MINQWQRIIAFWVLLIVVILSANSFLLTGLRLSTTGIYGQWNRMMRGELGADILIAGSSRATVHFDCAKINQLTRHSCQNIGMDGTRLDLQYYALKIYLKYNPPPKIIIQEIDVDALSHRVGLYQPERFVPYLEEDELFQKLCLMDPSYWKNKYMPLYSFGKYGLRLSLPAVLGWFDLGPDSEAYWNGYSPQNKIWGKDFQQFKEANPKGITYSIEEAEVQSLEMIINMVKSKNIDLIFVYTPEYFEMQRLTRNRKEIFVRAALGSSPNPGSYRIPISAAA